MRINFLNYIHFIIHAQLACTATVWWEISKGYNIVFLETNEHLS